MRLRDGNGGFRPYAELVDTLLHELTHNMVGPHDVRFWSTFGRIKKCYLAEHLERTRHPLRFPRPPKPPTVKVPATVAQCEECVRDHLLREAQTNGALQPGEREGAAQAGRQVEGLVQLELARAAEEERTRPTVQRSREDKEELRRRMAEAAAKRLGPAP